MVQLTYVQKYWKIDSFGYKDLCWQSDVSAFYMLSRLVIAITLFSSVTQPCLTLCDPMDRSMPGFPVFHYFLEFAQTPVHWVSDAIQLSHPLSPPSSFALSLSPSIRVFSSKPALCIMGPKYWSFSFCIILSNEYSGLFSFWIDWFNLAVQGTLKSLFQYHN